MEAVTKGENKNKQELSIEQLEMVTGGGTKEAEEYLEKLLKEKGVERWDLYDNMTPEEYQHYCNLYNDVAEPPSATPPKPFQLPIPNLIKTLR